MDLKTFDEMTAEQQFAFRMGYAQARWDDLANGERVEPDYEAAAKALWSHTGEVDGQWPTKWDVGTEHIRQRARAIVDAAVVSRLLVDPPKEEERDGAL